MRVAPGFHRVIVPSASAKMTPSEVPAISASAKSAASVGMYSPCFRQHVPLLGQHGVHRDVVRLRLDRVEGGELVANTDRDRSWVCGGEGAIEIAAAVAQAVALRIETDQRGQHKVR